MEVNFEKSKISCLDTVVQEIQNSEQTQEIKLPDGMPDIGRVLGAWGQTILRGKEWHSDSVSFSGGMMVWVLYAPEDDSGERCIDAWVPFQMKWELPAGTPEGSIRLQCLPRFVDARSVSPRKIMVRAGMGAMMMAMAPKTVELYAQEETLPGVELLRSTYPVRLPQEAGEKTFLMDEELVLPDSAPQAEKLICYRIQPRITDKKVLSTKLVFRGNADLHTLYRSEDGQLYSWDFEVPFSQYTDLSGEHSTDAQAELLMCPTSLELELDDEGHLRLRCGLVAQYLITDKQLLELIEDAYSPGRELEIHQSVLEVPAVLENRRENLYGEQTIHADASRIVDASFQPDFPRQQRQENRVEMPLNGTFSALYYDENGMLQSGSTRWEGMYSLNADENTAITAAPSGAQVQAGNGAGGIQLKAELPMEVTAAAAKGIPMVTGVSVGEAKKADPARPSLILRRAGEKRLWDIAKDSGSTVDAIRKANGLQEEPAPGQMLLIPVP